jgi:hypothetical protein
VLWKSSVIFMVLLGGLMAQTAVPKFEDFPVKEIFKGTPAKPVFRTASQRMFRTRIREGAAAGPNFAGHYAIARWGCGSFCESIEIIDSKTGIVHDGPFGILGFMPVDEYQDVNVDDLTPDRLGVEFKINSRLLIARGCEEDKDCASFFYEWTGTQFKLVLKLPVKPRVP